jgi:hypothetical protein
MRKTSNENLPQIVYRVSFPHTIILCMNKTSGPLSVVATTGFNFYLTYLYDKQHILCFDRELCYLYHSFLYLSSACLFDYYCHNYMTSSEVKLNVQRSYKNIKGQMYWIRLLKKYWMMRGTYFHSSVYLTISFSRCRTHPWFYDVESLRILWCRTYLGILWCRTHLGFYDVEHTYACISS